MGQPRKLGLKRKIWGTGRRKDADWNKRMAWTNKHIWDKIEDALIRAEQGPKKVLKAR
jgi:hypothetical protein